METLLTRLADDGREFRSSHGTQEVFAFPASYAQQRLWFLEQLSPGNVAYLVPLHIDWDGPLDADVLARALNEVVRRHEALRTCFASVAGQPVQVIVPALTLDLPFVDLSTLPADEAEAEAQRLLRAETERPFELWRAPLVRPLLLRTAPARHLLSLTLHHAVCDGWSLGVLRRELRCLYSAFSCALPSPLPEPPVQYADYALWQRARLRGPRLASQLDWWRRQLRGAPPTLELPSDRRRRPTQGYGGAWRRWAVGAGLAAALREAARGEGATLFMALLAGLGALLYRYTGEGEVVVGTPIAGRQRTELRGWWVFSSTRWRCGWGWMGGRVTGCCCVG
jgi:fengycin family lipopeptide synthetase B